MKTLENTISTIFELADSIQEGTILVNGDSQLAKSNSTKNQIIYTTRGIGKWKAKNIKTTLNGTNFTAVKGKRSIKLQSQLLGEHQVGPLMAAVFVADKLGLTSAQIKKGIAATEAEGRRFKLKDISDGVAFIDDTYNGNPDGFKTGIQFLSNLKEAKRRVYITGGIIELGKDKQRIHRWLGVLLGESKIERIILIRTPATAWILEGINEVDSERKIEWVEPEAKIYENLEQYSSKGDVILMQSWAKEKVFYKL